MTYQLDDQSEMPKDFALTVTANVVQLKEAHARLADKPEPILTPERKDGVFKAYKDLRALEWNENEFGLDAQTEELVHLVFQAILEQDSQSDTSVIAERINELLQSMDSPFTKPQLMAMLRTSIAAYFIDALPEQAADRIGQKIADVMSDVEICYALRIPLAVIGASDQEPVGVARYYGIPTVATSYEPSKLLPMEPLDFGYMKWIPMTGQLYELKTRQQRKILENVLAEKNGRKKARQLIRTFIADHPGEAFLIGDVSPEAPAPREETVPPQFTTIV